MSQAKHRRRAARHKARRERRAPALIHITYTGEARNPIGRRVSLDKQIAVGFGYASIDRDGRQVVNAEGSMSGRQRRLFCDRDGYVTLRQVDRYIERRRLWRNRWTAHIGAPLWSATWERKGRQRWVCVEAGEGFA